MRRLDEMRQGFAAQDLVNVEQTSLLIRIECESFADYWEPVAAGEGPFGKYLVGLEPGAPGSSRRGGQGRLRDGVAR